MQIRQQLTAIRRALDNCVDAHNLIHEILKGQSDLGGLSVDDVVAVRKDLLSLANAIDVVHRCKGNILREIHAKLEGKP